MKRLLSLAFTSTGVLALAVACSGTDSDPSGGLPSGGGPGTGSYNDGGPDTACATDTDCDVGEVCAAGQCQIQRCAELDSYQSQAPLGVSRFFGTDRELLAVGGGTSNSVIQGYEPRDGTFAQPDGANFDVGATGIVDIAGGNTYGERPEAVVAAIEFTPALRVVRGGTVDSIPIGFSASSVATGDVDNDGLDEIVALSASGNFAICRAVEKTCETGNVSDGVGSSVTGVDVTAADIDEDGFVEPVFLTKTASGSQLVVYNHDSASTQQQRWQSFSSTDELAVVSAGQFDSTPAAEVYVLKKGGTFSSDEVRVLNMRENASVLDTFSVNDAVDVLAGDLDSDDRAEVSVLNTSNQVDVYSRGGTASHTLRYSSALSSTSTPKKLGKADVDGDSPMGRLMGGPELRPGNLVPLVVMLYPPYSRTFSDGVSSVTVGSAESVGEDQSVSVGIKASVAIGIEGEIPGIAKVALGAKVGLGMKYKESIKESLTYWERYQLKADPLIEGANNGAVVLGCGCYHTYLYEMSDPAGRYPGLGSTMEVHIPVGGQTNVLSIKRYNSMAADLGLPQIAVPYDTGDPSSYPSSPQTLDGRAIDPSTLLFSETPTFRVSDTAQTSWRHVVGETQTNTVSTSIYLGAVFEAKGALGIGAFVKGEAGAEFEEAYSVSVGKQALFSGSVPPIRDNPATPEDEYGTFSYSFTPYVYTHEYTDGFGNPASFYVMTYSVTP